MFLRTARRIIDDWSVQSQLTARRNAMVAATTLAQRTAEAREVDEFLAHLASPTQPAGQVPAARRA